MYIVALFYHAQRAVSAAERLFYYSAERVAYQYVHLLYPRRVIRRDAQSGVRLLRKRSAAGAGQRNRRDAELFRAAHGFQHVRAVSARRYREQNVARASVRLELAREDSVEAVIVADGGERRSVARKSRRVERLALREVTARELRRYVLRVSRRAAVAADERNARRRAARRLSSRRPRRYRPRARASRRQPRRALRGRSRRRSQRLRVRRAL